MAGTHPGGETNTEKRRDKADCKRKNQIREEVKILNRVDKVIHADPFLMVPTWADRPTWQKLIILFPGYFYIARARAILFIRSRLLTSKKLPEQTIKNRSDRR